nr:DUF4132 domain-containing protein [Bacillus thuringiensis]
MPKPFPYAYLYNEGLKFSYLLAKSGGKHMAVYRNVQVNFWQDEFILDLTPEERYFYIYLLTGTKTKQCGIYILPKRVAELETGYSMETVEKLLKAFRYAEGGVFCTIDGKSYQLSSGTVIGFVHPLELPEAEKELWKEQLESAGIVQPFLQIERPVFVVEENDESAIERFGGILLNGRSLFGKMTKLGWIRGSVQDGGVYYTFYKEDTRTGLGVQLSFSGAPIGYEDEEDVCVFDIQFYKAGTVNRGSYEYDEIDDERRIVPKEVDKRFFSEMLYDVQVATDSNLGHNESWRRER